MAPFATKVKAAAEWVLAFVATHPIIIACATCFIVGFIVGVIV